MYNGSPQVLPSCHGEHLCTVNKLIEALSWATEKPSCDLPPDEVTYSDDRLNLGSGYNREVSREDGSGIAIGNVPVDFSAFSLVVGFIFGVLTVLCLHLTTSEFRRYLGYRKIESPMVVNW